MWVCEMFLVKLYFKATEGCGFEIKKDEPEFPVSIKKEFRFFLWIRDSIISLVRQFEGPGKRGKLNIKKASKSKVNVMVSQNPED